MRNSKHWRVVCMWHGGDGEDRWESWQEVMSAPDTSSYTCLKTEPLPIWSWKWKCPLQPRRGAQTTAGAGAKSIYIAQYIALPKPKIAVTSIYYAYSLQLICFQTPSHGPVVTNYNTDHSVNSKIMKQVQATRVCHQTLYHMDEIWI